MSLEVGAGVSSLIIISGCSIQPPGAASKQPPVDIDRGFQPVIPPTQLHRDRTAKGVSHDAYTIEVEPAIETAIGVQRDPAISNASITCDAAT